MEAKSTNNQSIEEEFKLSKNSQEKKVLCVHCRRTPENGIRCI